MRLWLSDAIIVMACVVGACEAPTPARVRVVDLDADGEHHLTDVRLETDPDLSSLASGALRLRGGGRVVIDGLRFQRAEAEGLDADAARHLALEHPGRPVEFRYLVEGDVAIPDDHESLLMASAYHGLERARAFFWRHDVSLATRSTLEVCFGCGLFVDLGVPLPYIVNDNAAYVAFADTFVLFPELLLGEVPIAADAAILSHELSHRVFRYAVYSGAAYARLLDAFSHQAALSPEEWRTLNLLKALDEGSADFFAAAFAGNPRFATASLGALGEGAARDLEGARARGERYDQVFEQAAAQNQEVVTDAAGGHAIGSGDWDPYHLGTLWAGALWRLGADEDGARDLEQLREQVVPMLLRALRTVGAGLEQRFVFDFELAVRALVEESAPEQRARVCALLADTFPGQIARVDACS